MREIVLDTETTGLDPDYGHRVIEIGCIELRNRTPTGQTYRQFINPERDVPEEAYRISKISTAFLKPYPVFAMIADAFLEFIADTPLVIHNAQFDMKFLNSELKRLGRPLLAMDRTIDTAILARKRFPGAPASLDALCRRFGIGLGEREDKGHGALLDCALLAQVYLELTGGRQPVLGLSNNPTNPSGGPSLARKSPALQRAKALPSRLTGAERAAHEAFIKTLKGDVLWRKP
jgi:DNA polymerase-3 subunit epsilon